MAGRWWPGLAATGTLLVGLVSSVLVPASASGTGASEERASGIEVVTPKADAWVTGVVRLMARADDGTSMVLFEVSLDGGDTWTAVGTDVDSQDGWSAEWDSLAYNGRARIRASDVEVPVERDAVSVRVDNIAPTAEVSATPRLFSPNGDGRRDRSVLGLRSNEPVKARVAVVRAGEFYSRWKFGRYDRTRRVVWKGRVPRDGSYRIVAKVKDRAGLRSRATKRVVIDRRRPRLNVLSVAPKPSKDPGRIRIRYRAKDRSDPLRMRARIVSGGGTLSGKKSRVGSGRHTLRLRTRYANGDKLFPGQYELQVRATDRAGNPSMRARVWRVHRAMKARVYRRLEGTGRKVALTFDDCHYEDAWESILDTLDRLGEKATFFCPGRNLGYFPHLARRTVLDGHTVGSHGWDHAVLSNRSFNDVYWRLMRDRSTWIDYGATSAPYFRPPYGAYDSTTVAGAGATSHPRVMMWDVTSGDTSGASGSALVCNVLCWARPGSIVLLHTKDVTADVLPEILEGLKDRNLEQVTLAELFRAAGHR